MVEFECETEVYEGVPVSVALALAVMEKCGVRELIRNVCSQHDERECRTVSVDMAAKTVLGTFFDRSAQKTAMYLVNEFYSLAPTDLLFGNGVKPKSLSDTSLARCFDAIFKADLPKLTWDCHRAMCGAYGLSTDVFFMDATNYTLFGVGKPGPGNSGTSPEYGGNAKNSRNDLMQKNIHTVTGGHGVLAYSRPYDGNVSDVEMNRDAIEFLKDEVDPKKSVVTGDCKMAVSDIIDRMIELGFGFVTKVPESFNNKVRSLMTDPALGMMEPSSSKEGRLLYDTDCAYGTGTLRFVAYRHPGARERSEEYIRTKGFEKAERTVKKQKSSKYFCEDDARKAFEKLIASYDGVYFADAEYRIDPRLEKIDPGGPHWRAYPGMVWIDEERVGNAAERHSTGVLVTNIPRTAEKADDLRKGATRDEVVDLYLGQYLAEKGFRLMKSGMGVGHVYIHTHSRQDVMSFIVSLAAMLQNLIDAVLKREIASERPLTMKRLTDRFCRCYLKYDRGANRASFAGTAELKDEFFKVVEALGLEKRLLLGY